MDKKQTRILKEIFKRNNINKNATFMQYRNLREFRYFTIERINPNHIIELYGKLKNGNPKKDVCLNVHVGRIIIPYFSLIVFIFGVSPIEVINILILILSNMLVSISIYYICCSINVMRFLHDCINRGNLWCGKSWKWKNTLSY
jgi:hypothetical protein